MLPNASAPTEGRNIRIDDRPRMPTGREVMLARAEIGQDRVKVYQAPGSRSRRSRRGRHARGPAPRRVVRPFEHTNPKPRKLPSTMQILIRALRQQRKAHSRIRAPARQQDGRPTPALGT
jgi:hypothetical protein